MWYIIRDIIRFFFKRPPLLLIFCIIVLYAGLKQGIAPTGAIIAFLVVFVLPFSLIFISYVLDSIDRNREVTKQQKNELPHGFIFGKSRTGKIYTRAEDAKNRDGHILIVGAPSSGKSSCIAIPTLLLWKKRVFVIDIKGELYKESKHSPNRQNVKIFNPKDPYSWGYNPLHLLDYTDNKPQEATAIANALIPPPQSNETPYWANNARDLLKGAILHYHHEGLNFIEIIYKVLDTPLETLLKEIRNSKAPKARIYVNGFTNLKPETVGGIYTELSQNLRLYITDNDIEKALSKKNYITPIDLESSDIYVTIPEHQIDDWSNLLTLMVNQFLTHFEKRDETKELIPILFLLDEFPRLGVIDRVVKGLGTLRSKKITMALMIQNIAQLDSIYTETTRESICGNCVYTVVLKVIDDRTQSYFSKRIGTRNEVIQITKSENYEAYSSFESGHGESTTTGEKTIFKPEQFLTFDDVIVFAPFGRGVYRMKKVYHKEINVKDIKLDKKK